ncbi:MAG: hypothetical protein ABSF29_08530 [Tepidisphaeraceae bacterium]
MRKIAQITVKLTGMALTMALAACFASPAPHASQQNYSQTPPLALPPPGPYGVTVDSRWNYSAYENRPATTWLLERARDINAEGSAGLDKLVQRWPDLTLDLLRDGVVEEADLPLCMSIADSYDRVFATADPAAGWSAALTASVSGRDAYAAFRNARQRILILFKSGEFADSAKIDPAAALPTDAPPALRTEALRLAGLSALLNDRPDRASDLFTRAADSAREGPRHVQFEIGVLLSESERRAGQPGAAALAWQNAIVSAADVRDPDLWGRAILTKPQIVDWPPQADIAGPDEPDFSDGKPPDTGDVLIGIGKMRLVRGAPQAALLDFCRAETETTVPGRKSLARIYRVQSMLALQLVASALPMLDGLVKSPDPRIACRAQAIEGDVLCRIMGDRKHGVPMMRNALENPNGGDWPGKTRLSANFALYCILEGNDEKGLQLLHLAEARFEAESQWEDLARALLDEAAYLRTADKEDNAEIVQKRADQICRMSGLPVGPLTDEAAADKPVQSDSDSAQQPQTP